MSNLLEDLNHKQREAVTTTEGFVRVIAGAGSGKTRALTHRFAYLVNDIGIMPSNILCVTFTNKSANEMKQRIRHLTGDDDTGYISTFHGFCVSVLQEDIHVIHYPKSFLVLDNEDINAMLEMIYEERGLTMRHMTYKDARDMIEIRKLFKDPQYYEYMIAFTLDELLQKYKDASATEDIIFWGYLYQQKKCFGLDYNDLIKYVLYIFSFNKEIQLKWQQRLEYVMIDEYQDIDKLQHQLMTILCNYHKNLFVVGDPDQTIYTWRGASVRYILDFDKQFPGTKTIMMLENYRSTPQVLAAANSLISKNKDRIQKNLIPVLPDGEPVIFHHAKSTEEEAKWIAAKIKDLAGNGTKLSDIAVLYRAHYVTRTVEDVLLKEQLPYQIYGNVQFFERMEIKDALSYLRLIVYKDDLSFLRVVNVPGRNIGQKRIKRLKEYAEQNKCSLYEALKRITDEEHFRNTKAEEFIRLIEHFNNKYHDISFSDLLSSILDESGYETMLRTKGDQERLDNLAELKQAVYEYETSSGEETRPEEYLSHIALMTNKDIVSGKNAVKLMTVHTAKGLEFPFVFLCSLNEGIFPSKKTATKEQMEEERRLAFVAFTRAQNGLYLTDSEGWNLEKSFKYPSRFIFDVDKTLIVYTNELEERLISDANRHILNNKKTIEAVSSELPFKPGDRIVHFIMGPGEVVEIDNKKSAYVIKFDELPTLRKISIKAPLEAEDQH